MVHQFWGRDYENIQPIGQTDNIKFTYHQNQPQYDDTDLKSRLSAIEEIIESIDGETDAGQVMKQTT